MEKLLSDVKVLDLTQAMAGPFSTMFLGDMGADIIKVEAPKGEESRHSFPRIEGRATMNLSLNRNKRSVVANLKDPKEREYIVELAKKADVIVENFRPGVAGRLGLGYEELKEHNPRLIYASCSGFGQYGPYHALPAYDIVVQGFGGLMSVTGPKGQGPTRCGFSVGDAAAGLYTAIGVLTALLEREKSGVGQLIDVSMLDCQIAISENALARYLYNHQIPEPIGNQHSSIAPYEEFNTADGSLLIAAGTQKTWLALCDALGLQELSNDARFANNSTRCANRDELHAVLENILQKNTSAYWIDLLGQAQVPFAPILAYNEAADSAQMQESGMIQVVEHAEIGPLKIPGFPIHFSRTPCSVQRPAPLLGEHMGEDFYAV